MSRLPERRGAAIRQDGAAPPQRAIMLRVGALLCTLLASAGCEETVRWMLMPDGRGDVQVAVLKGLQPRRVAMLDSVEFLLYSRNNPNEPERRRMNASCLPIFSHFRPERRSVMLVHGFGDSAATSYMYPLLKDAFLERGDYNVLTVDWAEMAAAPWYATAASNTGPVGRHTAALLDHLVGSAGADLERFHLLGFSLGAHVAGLAARHVTAGGVGRVTGLDPAQVLFHGAGPDSRLDASDAALVEVVHTSGGYLGFQTAMGHRDYFPNGGAWPQPGCMLDFVGVCSHRRAYYYYAEALRSEQSFQAVPCPTWDLFQAGQCSGDLTPQLLATDTPQPSSVQGTFYFDTNPQAPFGRPPQEPSNLAPFSDLYAAIVGV